MARNKICLIVVFNHRFDKNLPTLDTLYRNRFDHVRHLMPFYDGPRKDVIPVYDSSYVFQGYFAQAAPLLMQGDFDHYVFVGDDVLLNPRLNQDNLLQTLGVESGQAYIKELIPLWDRPTCWRHTIPSLRSFKRDRYNEFHAHLPPHEQFVEAFERQGHRWREMSRRELLPYLLWDFRQERHPVQLENLLFWLVHLSGRTRQYPCYYSYSDFLVVPAEKMKAFCHYCGLFASMGTFVEVAVPTALMLACERIVLQKHTKLRADEVLDINERSSLIAKHGGRLDDLLAAMREDQLYVHPVKISKLTTGEPRLP